MSFDQGNVTKIPGALARMFSGQDGEMVEAWLLDQLTRATGPSRLDADALIHREGQRFEISFILNKLKEGRNG